MKLVVGNKRASSWSLRPWLALKVSGIPFEEISIPLYRSDTGQAIRRYSSAGKVPVLLDGPITVWESSAIGEYLAERFPAARLWPVDPYHRALARSVSHEMHAGFAKLRDRCPFAIGETLPTPSLTPALRTEIARIEAVWTECRRRSVAMDGPFLFGHFTYADAMFAPVASRFATYRLPLESREAAIYRDMLLALPAMREWATEASREPRPCL